jgi:hypothetical protein
VLQSVLSYCSATDISVLEKIGLITLTDNERKRYITPLRDMPSYDWILSRIDLGDKVILVGSDLSFLHFRISDPIEYNRQGLWQRAITLWVAIVPRFSIYKSGSNIVTNGRTLVTERITKYGMSCIVSEMQRILRNGGVIQREVGKYGDMNKSITSFVPSSEILVRWNQGEQGWMRHSGTIESSMTKIRLMEYHNELNMATSYTRSICGILDTREEGCNLITDYTRTDNNGIRTSNMFTLYTELHIDPWRMNISNGRPGTNVMKKGMHIVVRRRSEGRDIDKRRLILRIPIR